MQKINKKIKAIDLFAGIGGIRIGFESAGFEIAYSKDIDKKAAEISKAAFGVTPSEYKKMKGLERENFIH